jgi:DNA-binding CsgD family transcriptional regulator
MENDRLTRAHLAVERACEEAASVVDLCQGVRSALESVLPSDRWCGFAVDPSTLFATNGYHDEGVDGHLVPRLLELEVGAEDVNQLPALARTKSGVASITDMTSGDPAASARWREVIVPSGLSYELRALFRTGAHAWGALIFFRGADVADFTAADQAFVHRIAPTVADGFRRVLVRQHLDHGEDTREAGILVLGGDPIEIRTATPAARDWLAALDDGTLGGDLPTAIQSAAFAARARRSAPATVRARTRSGRWLTITAEVTVGDGDEPRDVGAIVQPSRPAEIAQIVTAAHGLTRREADTVLLVASGRTNQEIARALDVSTYTVADHLKSVFAKLGVASRGELTSKLFFGHYFPRVAANLDAGADGWFLPG